MYVVRKRLTVQNGAVVQQSSSDAVYLTPLALHSKKKTKKTVARQEDLLTVKESHSMKQQLVSEMSKQADVLKDY